MRDIDIELVTEFARYFCRSDLWASENARFAGNWISVRASSSACYSHWLQKRADLFASLQTQYLGSLLECFCVFCYSILLLIDNARYFSNLWRITPDDNNNQMRDVSESLNFVILFLVLIIINAVTRVFDAEPKVRLKRQDYLKLR